MTLDELEKAFVDGCYRSILTNREDLPEKAHRRAGIRAVVLAIRDEIGLDPGYCDECKDNKKLFREILASDGVEAAVDRTVYGMSVSKIISDGIVTRIDPVDMYKEPAAAPVCEWTHGFTAHENRKWWRGTCGWSFYGTPPFENCKCGKPIKFKSEAAR